MCKTVIIFKLFVHICILVYTKNPLKKIKMKDLCLSFNYCDSERCLMEINVFLSDLDWNVFILDLCTFFNHWLRTKWKPWLKSLKIHFIFYSKHCFLRQTKTRGLGAYGKACFVNIPMHIQNFAKQGF